MKKMVIAASVASLAIIGFTLKVNSDVNSTLNLEVRVDPHEVSVHEIKYAELDELRLAYLEKGNGEPVILVHGFPDTASTYEPTISFLAEHGYRAIAIFMPGYYPSGFTKNGRYSPYIVSRILKSFVDKLGIRKFTLVGHDWGASVAYAYANQFPDDLSHVVALAIPPPALVKNLSFSQKLGILTRTSHFATFQFGLYSRWYASRRNFAYIDYLVRLWAPSIDLGRYKVERVKKLFSFPGRLKAALGYYESLRNESGDEAVQAVYDRKISVPGTILLGDEDILKAQAFSDIKEYFSAPVEFQVVRNAGHFIQIEKPEALNEILLKVLHQAK